MTFTLVDKCNVLGSTEIDFYWKSPDRQQHKIKFHGKKGEKFVLGEFAWAGTEVSGSAPLYTQAAAFATVNLTDPIDLSVIWHGNKFCPGGLGSEDKLVPGRTQTISEQRPAQNECTCRANVQYTVTYTLRSYADLPQDCLAAKLRPGNIHTADGWDEVRLPTLHDLRPKPLAMKLATKTIRITKPSSMWLRRYGAPTREVSGTSPRGS